MKNLLIVLMLIAAPASGQWTYTLTNWSGRGARTQLWEALDERWTGIGFTDLESTVSQPGWWSTRSWIQDFDNTLGQYCTEFVDSRFVTNNTLDGYFASTGAYPPPMWTYSNLLVTIGATNKPNNSNFQHPQFSNYTTNGVLPWIGVSGYEFYKERKDALNQLLIHAPSSGGGFYKTNQFSRGGYGSGLNLAAAKSMCETNYSADTNAAGAASEELYASFYTNAFGGAEAWMARESLDYVITHFDSDATGLSSRVIWYVFATNAGFAAPQVTEFDDNGIGLLNVSEQSAISNYYAAGSSMTWTSNWNVADSTNLLTWFVGGIVGPNTNHVRGVRWFPDFATYDYSVSNGFKYVP